jgi:hypothetical protein
MVGAWVTPVRNAECGEASQEEALEIGMGFCVALPRVRRE